MLVQEGYGSKSMLWLIPANVDHEGVIIRNATRVRDLASQLFFITVLGVRTPLRTGEEP